MVRPVNGAHDRFEIIAGERRWRAAQRAGLHEVPIVVLEVSDSEALELAIIENVQRADLNPLEEAHGYQALADEYNHSQDDIAKIVGKSRSHVANTLRLLKLPARGEGLYQRRQAHGRPCARADRRARSAGAAKRIVERRPQRAPGRGDGARRGRPERKPQKARGGKAKKDADTMALEKRVSDALGLAVSVDHRDPGGTVQISYRNLDQLDEVMRRLAKGG